MQRISDPKLTRGERVLLRCELSRELEESGNFEAARGALGELWTRLGERPAVENLTENERAAVLLRVGTLTGYLGSMQQFERGQELAKDLISEALTIYESLAVTARIAEARIELAWCYWREGAFDEARVILDEAVSGLDNQEPELRATALVRRAVIEKEATQFSAALKTLDEAARYVRLSPDNHALQGSYHNTLAMALRNQGEAEKREDYIDRALIEYAAASYHFEQAGHTHNRASVENNLGVLYFKAGKLDKAREHLERARRLFETVKDAGRIAVVNETRARVLLAEGRNFKAERLMRPAVKVLEAGGETAHLIEALTTHAVALARLAQYEKARGNLARAVEVGQRLGNHEGAGRAAMTVIEELHERLTNRELREAYELADGLLQNSHHPETIERLRRCARTIIQAAQGMAPPPKPDAPKYAAFVHAAPQTTEMLRQLERASLTDATLLITGETGTGKEVLAKLVHECSGRAGALVTLNCAALNEELIESEVFGHKKGSFTDACEDYAGAAKMAEGGTLFLDEIGELSEANQAKILRLLENKEVRALGSERAERVDVRIVAATNRNLLRLVQESLFRLDLYHRLCVFEVALAPLRERREDIRPLAEFFITAALRRHGRRVTFTEESLLEISRLELRGNARELRSLIERTVIMAKEGDVVTARAVQTLAMRRAGGAAQGDLLHAWRGCSLGDEMKAYEKDLIRRALEECRGSITETARLLGISHQSLIKKINSIHPELFGARKEPRRRSIIRKK
ncbi:MAG TPA: sigma 54-interacting transcriptional regulator [Pyrinomonadaceae bacterium]|nr:sigma 54-interacting transcriptional regulator [Pyrinomonadaceae bacterium]